MINHVTDLGPFPGSDHSALAWQMIVRTKYEIINKRTLDYNKANTDAIKHELKMIDWHVLLD